MIQFFKFLTPINISEEKEKFLDSDDYNPYFRYDWKGEKLQEFLAENEQYKKFFYALLTQERDLITKESEELFQTKIEDKTLSLAKKIVSKKPRRVKKFDPSDVKKAFEDAFNTLGIDYAFKLSDEYGFNFRSAYDDKTIIMSKHAFFQFFSIEGEVKHELVHIIRSVNGNSNNISPSLGYMSTEEGLACYMQDYTTKDGEASLFQHAAEYVATSYGINGSLRDIYNFFVSIGFDKELAWQRSIRHKFGFTNTSKPGDILKPAMYFYFEENIKKLSKGDILKLFIGKITIDELLKYKEYKGEIPEDKLKEFFDIK